MKRGITVVELLVVILIIVLLAALLISVGVETRRRAYQSPCMSNMRQIYVAWASYLTDYNGMPSLSALVAPTRPVFVCPADPYPDGANARVQQFTGVRGSYFYLFNTPTSVDSDFVRDLQEADPNHGILVCVLHGRRADPETSSAWSAYKGLVLRLCRDGSVQRARQTATCDQSGNRGRCLWDLMTDVRTHPARSAWCPGSREGIPCE